MQHPLLLASLAAVFCPDHIHSQTSSPWLLLPWHIKPSAGLSLSSSHILLSFQAAPSPKGTKISMQTLKMQNSNAISMLPLVPFPVFPDLLSLWAWIILPHAAPTGFWWDIKSISSMNFSCHQLRALHQWYFSFHYNYAKNKHNYLAIMALNKPKAQVTDEKCCSAFCSALKTSLCLEEQLKPTELLK